LQVTNKQGKFNPTAVDHVDSYDDLQEGNLVVVNLEKTERDDPPFIGKVIEVEDNMVSIVWLKGAYNKPWKEWFDGCGKNRRRRCDIIPVQSIMLFGFSLATG
jgi:hypothetical protein